MRLRHLFSLFASAILLFSGSIHAQNSNPTSTSAGARTGNNSATIEGTVYDPKGRVITGARITLLIEMSVLEVRESDSQGKFKFEGLVHGTYSVLGIRRGSINCATTSNCSLAKYISSICISS